MLVQIVKNYLIFNSSQSAVLWEGMYERGERVGDWKIKFNDHENVT